MARIRARLRRASREHGASRDCEPVEKPDAPLAVCDRVGFKPHHDYHYRGKTF